MNPSSLRHITLAMLANLLTAGLALFAETLAGPQRYASWLAAVGLWGLLWLAIRYLIQPRWVSVRSIWHYLLPTAPVFWFLEERREREALAKRIDTLEKCFPDVWVVSEISNPERQTEALRKVVERISTMPDGQLALVVDQIRANAATLIRPGTDSYPLFRIIIGIISSLEGSSYPRTWDYFLRLLSDVFERFDLQIRQDVIVPLQEAILNVDRGHLHQLRLVIETVMTHISADHSVARAVLKMLLDTGCSEDVFQMIFDECKRRARRYPEDFGYALLETAQRLEHRVFSLDIESLHQLVADPDNYDSNGIIAKNKALYGQLCATVFSPLVDPRHPDNHHGRVYRRLVGDAGRVEVKCKLSGGEECSCAGESLSFRGVYSDKCDKNPGQKITRTELCPIRDQSRQIAFSACIAGLHTGGKGRGILLEEGTKPSDVRMLYDYIKEAPS